MFQKLRRRADHSLGMKRITWLVIVSHLLWSQAVLAQGMLGSVGLVSNVTGKAMIYHEGQEAAPLDASLRTPVVFGDRIQTGIQSLIAVLVGDDALVSMKELTELSVEEEAGFPKFVKLAKGQVCISTKRKSQPVTVKVPWGTVTVPPGSLVGIEVGPVQVQPQEAQSASPESYLHRTAMGDAAKSGASLVFANEQTPSTVTVQVIEGSASLVSQVAGKVSVTVAPKQTVQMVKGDIKPPFKSNIVQCQVQNIQADPQHTAIPEETKAKILEDQQKQATQLVQIMTVAASFPESSLSANLIGVNNEVVSTTSITTGGDDITASPGDPLVQIGNSFLNFAEPFLIASTNDTTVNGPPVILSLSGFTGDVSQVDPAQALANNNILPQQVALYLDSFRNPNDPDKLLAGIRVQSSPSEGPANVFGGLALTNSQIDAPVEFVQIGQTGNAQESVITLSGSILNLQDSTFNGQETFIALRNGELNAQTSSQPLVVVAGSGSDFTLSQGKSFITTNPSVIVSPSGILTVTGGASANIGGSLIELDNSFLDATGAQQRLVNVENGSSLTIADHFIDAQNNSALLAPGGVLSVVGNSRVDIGNDFALVDTASGFNVPNGLAIDANNSQVDINGYIFALSNGGSLTEPSAVPLVNVNNSSVLEADGVLRLASQDNQTFSSGFLALLMAADATSTVTLGEAVLKIEDSTGLTVGSVVPLLPFVSGSTSAAVALIDNSQVSFTGDLLPLLNGQAETVPGVGVLRATGNSQVTVGDYVVALSNGASLTTNGVPVVTLTGSTLQADGLLRLSQSGTVPTGLLGNLVQTNGGSSVNLSEAVLKIENSPGVTVASLDPLLPFSGNLTSDAVLVQVDNSQDVTFQGDLVTANGTTFTVPGAGVLRATGNSQVTIGDYVVALSNNGSVNNGVPVVTLTGSTLEAEGLLRVSQPGTVSAGLLGNLVQANGGSTVRLSEAVINVVNTEGVTVASLAPLLPFAGGLVPQGVVALVENSQVTFQGDLLSLVNGQNFTVPGAGVLQANDSAVTVGDYVVALAGGASLTTNGVPVVTLTDSTLQADGLLRVSQPGVVPTGLLGDLVQVEGESGLSLSEAVLKVANTTGVTVASIDPLLAFRGNLTSSAVLALVENSQGVTFQGDLVTANGTTFTVPQAGVLRATGNSQVTVANYVAAESTSGRVVLPFGPNENTLPAVTLVDSNLQADGLLRLTNTTRSSLPTFLISSLVDRFGSSSLQLTESVVKVENTNNFTVSSLESLLSLGTNLSAQGVVALFDNAELVEAGFGIALLNVSNQNLNAISGGVVTLTNDAKLVEATRPLLQMVNSQLTVGSDQIDGPGFLEVNGGSTYDVIVGFDETGLGDTFVGLNGSTLTVKNPLINVSGPGSVVRIASEREFGFLVGLLKAGRLEVINAPLISVSNGGSLTLDNINYLFGIGDTGSSVSVTNQLCSSACATIGNDSSPIPVLTENGGQINVTFPNSLQLTNAPAPEQVTISPNGAVIHVNQGTVDINPSTLQ